MLLKNFIIELDLMNGSVGVVKKIVYKNKNRPKNKDNPLPAYVIVEFINANLPNDKKHFLCTQTMGFLFLL